MTAPEDPYRRPEQPASDPSPTWGPPAAPQGYGAPPPPAYGPPPGAPGYGGAPYGYAPQSTSSQAIVALVLAIGSFVVFPLIPAIVALVLVPRAREEIDLSGGRVGGDGLLTAAKVVAWINIGLCIAGVLALAAVFVLLAGFGFS